MRRRNTPLFIAMSDGVLIGLIGALIGSGGLLGTILTFVFQMKKLRSEQKERAEAEIISQNERDEKAKEAQRQQIEVLKESTQAEINKLEKTMRDTLEQHRVEYVKEINDLASVSEEIIGKEFGGERPLYHTQDLILKDVTIHAGESALKETKNMKVFMN